MVAKKKNQKKQALDAKRRNAFDTDPAGLVVVGLDVHVPEDHELFDLKDDERTDMPLEEDTISDMMENGVDIDILFRKYKFTKGTVVWGEPLAADTELPVVVDGRRRTQHAREANRRLAEEKEPLIAVPVKQWKGAVKEAGLRMVVLNSHREDDPVLMKARKAKRLLSRIKDEAAVAKLFKVKVHQLREWINLLEAAPTVVKAVEKGFPASSAIELTRLPPDHQKTVLEEAIAAGETSKSKVIARVRRKVAESEGKKKSELPGKPPTVRELREVWEFIRESNSDLLDGVESVEQSAMGFLGIVCDGVFDSSKASKLIAHALKKLADAKAEAKKSKGKKPAEAVA